MAGAVGKGAFSSMKYLPALLVAALASAATTACSPSPESTDTAAASAATPTATAAGTQNLQPKEPEAMENGSEAAKDDAAAFVPAGAKLLETSKGDLNGDGIADALLVVDTPAPEGLAAGENGPHRSLLLVLGTAEGKWQLAARNDRLVPCSTCGGIAGDPFGYARVDNGTVTVVTSGGSRERWTDTYTFRYAPADKAWWVDSVSRHVIDTDTDAEKKKDFTAAELGKVRFEDFDPSTLAEVTLP